MNEDLHNFLGDLIVLVKEKYNQSLQESQDAIAESDRAFQSGANFAYYSILDLIQSQLESFDYDPKQFGQIVPSLGKKMIE
jgi:hypothetical protein